MESLLRTFILLWISASAIMSPGAEETAVVSESRINVRGQPSLIGEVVTQLQRGDQVTVLEHVKNERAKGGEPVNWARIKLPANTPVWVFGDLIKNGVVSASRVNLRAGPGENYSVIGRLNRGDRVEVIRSLGDWAEIEAPPGAYAFVDATLIRAAAPAAAAAAPVAAAVEAAKAPSTAEPEPAPPAAPPVAVAAAPAPVVPDALAPPTHPDYSAATPFTATIPASAFASASAPASSPAPQFPQELPAVAEPPPARTEAPADRRVVRREGVIRATRSIQAPTWYELIHPQTKKTLDYLNGEKLGISFKEYRGQKVVVSGEEAIDPRWPNTPILEVESFDIAP